MSTSIEWADESWNPMTGCTPASEACENCYALRMLGRNLPHHGGPTPTFHPDRLDKPLHWSKPRRIFVCSMSDLFHEAFTDARRDAVMERVLDAPQHTYMVLTKRPEAMRRYFTGEGPWPHIVKQGNLWLGVTAENQQRADERIPILLDTPAAVRFVSVEPMLSAVRLTPWLHGWHSSFLNGPRGGLDWVILGGETGPGARPMQPEWALDVYRQCKAADVPFFFKKWGRLGECEACEADGVSCAECSTMQTTREFPAVQP